mmetsp:Transcript_44346/g.96848  ORF Transcript_44346/g.96848 Transcript_44346/m.96848 type:complete len:313 (+) Transcript_44346:1381-2319(+)
MQSTIWCSRSQGFVSERTTLLPISPQSWPLPSIVRRRRRYCWPKLMQPCHSPQSLTVQRSPSQGTCPQLSPCSRPAEQGAPPFRAGLRTLRMRTCQPPPHVVEHCVHSDHTSMMQSCRRASGSSRQGFVSSRSPRHSGWFPLAWRETSRTRRFWRQVSGPAQVQVLQAVNSQLWSTWWWQAFVSSRGPLHGAPHCVFIRLITRERSQRPLHSLLLQGFSHSVQAPKRQPPSSRSSTVQAASCSQGFTGPGHSSMSTCVPAHVVRPSVAPSGMVKSGCIGLCAVMVRYLSRIREEVPHSALQPLQSDHSFQPQ